MVLKVKKNGNAPKRKVYIFFVLVGIPVMTEVVVTEIVALVQPLYDCLCVCVCVGV